MNEKMLPKWQREIKSFLGIKSCIILEGNVYDEFPRFKCEDKEALFQDIDDLDLTIMSLININQTDVFFFNPVDGFYCNTDNIESQRKMMSHLFDGYLTSETTKNHGSTLCVMPIGKGKKEPFERGKPYIWVSEIIRRAVSDKGNYTNKENIIFVLNFASRLNECYDGESESNIMFLNYMTATTAVQESQLCCNSIIMIVDKCNDIPVWFYLNNPNVRTISVCLPDWNTRKIFLENLSGPLAKYQILSDEECELGKQFIAETEGLRLQELKQVLQLAYMQNMSPESIDLAFKLYKYGVLDDPWEKLEDSIMSRADRILNERVKGQQEAINKVKTVLARAIKGVSGLQHSGASHKPRGVLFFAGPTGVGKTETAKSLAEAIFGDENACIRFDMSEYRLEQSDQKLFGAPPGYVGYEGGGQLTNAVKNKPFSVILFDEIEKASPTILDKFLQILEDGRMTDNQGNTVYFGETIIIFTSNIGLTKITTFEGAVLRREPTIMIDDPMKEDTQEFRNHVTEIITSEVKAYFNDNGRPELLNRLGENNIVVFQFINVDDAISICDYKFSNICNSIKLKKGIDIMTNEILGTLHEKAILERVHGGRGIGNMLEREFINPFSNFICSLSTMPAVLRCHNGEHGIEFEVLLSEN